MSDASHSNDSPDVSGYITARPNSRIPRSSEEEYSEHTDSETEVNSQGSNPRSLSQSPASLPHPSSPIGPYQQRMAREARYPSGDPYAAGPSRTRDLYTWEAMMRQELNVEDSRVVTGIPVERTAGMTMEELRQMQEMSTALTHCMARVNHQSQLLYETSHALERVSEYAEIAIEIADQGRHTLRKMQWLVSALGLVVLLMAVVFMYMMSS